MTELLSMIDESRTSEDGSFIAEMTTTQWLKQLPSEVLTKAIDLVNDEGYPLADIREFIETYGYKPFLAGHYETWSELTETYDDEAVQAFVEWFSVDDIDSFEDAFYGEFDSIRDVVEHLLEAYETLGDLPDWVQIDYEGTWRSALRFDYIFESGYLFNRNF